MHEAQLADSGSGRTPVTDGWFVVNVRDAEWWFAATRGGRCAFENEYGNPPVEFDQLGINITILEPANVYCDVCDRIQPAVLEETRPAGRLCGGLVRCAVCYATRARLYGAETATESSPRTSSAPARRG